MSMIFNPAGLQVGAGINLDLVNRKARAYGGVRRITITRQEYADKPGQYWGLVTVQYSNHYYAIVDFADYSHAVEWAYKRSQGNKSSWYAGCTVDHNFYF